MPGSFLQPCFHRLLLKNRIKIYSGRDSEQFKNVELGDCFEYMFESWFRELLHTHEFDLDVDTPDQLAWLNK